MGIYDKPSRYSTEPVVRYGVYAALGVFLCLIHLLFVGYIAVAGLTPDLLIILIVWIALSEGQMAGLFAGFLGGLLFDIVTSDIVGSNALAKTFVGFVAGYFYKEKFEHVLKGSYRFLLITFLTTLIHNLVYFFFYLRPTEINFVTFFLKHGVAATLYTSVAAAFPMLIQSQRRVAR